MNSGKTTKLLQNRFAYQKAGVDTYLLTPKVDTRNGVGVVEARIGLKAHADLVVNDNPEDTHLKYLIHRAYKTNGAIFIDEAQFIRPLVVNSIVDQCEELAYPNPNSNLTLYVYGLLTDYTDHLFSGTKAWLEKADSIRKEDTKCHFCNQKATRNLLTKNSEKNSSHVVIGDSAYYPVCSYHFWKYTHRSCR